MMTWMQIPLCEVIEGKLAIILYLSSLDFLIHIKLNKIKICGKNIYCKCGFQFIPKENWIDGRVNSAGVCQTYFDDKMLDCWTLEIFSRWHSVCLVMVKGQNSFKVITNPTHWRDTVSVSEFTTGNTGLDIIIADRYSSLFTDGVQNKICLPEQPWTPRTWIIYRGENTILNETSAGVTDHMTIN